MGVLSAPTYTPMGYSIWTIGHRPQRWMCVGARSQRGGYNGRVRETRGGESPEIGENRKDGSLTFEKERA